MVCGNHIQILDYLLFIGIISERFPKPRPILRFPSFNRNLRLGVSLSTRGAIG